MDWGKGILLTIIGFVILIMTMVVFSVRMDGIELVTENYYEEEIKYQNQIEKASNAAGLEQVAILFHPEQQELQLRLAKGAKGTLWLFRPSEALLDQKIELDFSKDKEQFISLKDLKAGYWKVMLSWQQEGKAYYEEKKIHLK